MIKSIAPSMSYYSILQTSIIKKALLYTITSFFALYIQVISASAFVYKTEFMETANENLYKRYLNIKENRLVKTINIGKDKYILQDQNDCDSNKDYCTTYIFNNGLNSYPISMLSRKYIFLFSSISQNKGEDEFRLSLETPAGLVDITLTGQRVIIENSNK